MVEVSLTVGKLDASLALLLTGEHHLIEFPTVLLPDGVSAGSVVTIRCEQDHALEKKEAEEFRATQDEILQLFGTHEPVRPNLHVKNVTQTSAVLEWDALDLGSASIKALTLYKNGTRLGQVPNPLASTTTKLSGLPVDTEYEFHLRLDTTAGAYESEKVKLKTHKMTDLSGITVCIGDIDPESGIDTSDIKESLKAIGARELQTEVAVDTTHFITTSGIGLQWKKAVDSNIPIVRPEWLKACEKERRIVGVRNFYLDADPKFLEPHKFTKAAADPAPAPAPAPETSAEIPAANQETAESTTIEASKETPVEEPTVEEPSNEEPPTEEAPTEEAPVSLEEPAHIDTTEQVTTEELPLDSEAEPAAEDISTEETVPQESIVIEEVPIIETETYEPETEEAADSIAKEEGKTLGNGTTEESEPKADVTVEPTENIEAPEPLSTAEIPDEVETNADDAFDDVDINGNDESKEEGEREATPTTETDAEAESKPQEQASGGGKKKKNKKKKGKK